MATNISKTKKTTNTKRASVKPTAKAGTKAAKDVAGMSGSQKSDVKATGLAQRGYTGQPNVKVRANQQKAKSK